MECWKTGEEDAKDNCNDKPQINARRRMSSSRRAESVTFPIRRSSKCNSVSSISRNSCLVGLNAKGSLDYETVYSRDRTDYDIQVTSIEEKKSPKNLNHKPASISLNEDQGYQIPNEMFSQRLLTVEHWLQLYNPVAERDGCIHPNKRVHAIPVPNETYGKTAYMTAGKEYNYEFTQKNVDHDKINNSADPRTGEESRSEEETDSSNLTCSSCMRNDRLMMQLEDKECACSNKNRIDKDAYICHICSDTINQEKNDEGFHELPAQKVIYEVECSEACILINNGTSSYTSASYVDEDTSTICQTEDSVLSHPDLEKEKLDVSTQHYETGITSLPSKMTRESVVHNEKNADQKDLIMPLSGSKKNSSGLGDHVKQKVTILIISIFLAIGLQSLGLGHDFFNAIMF